MNRPKASTIKALARQYLPEIDLQLSPDWTPVERLSGRKILIQSTIPDVMLELRRLYMGTGHTVLALEDGQARFGHKVERYLVFYPPSV